MNSILLHLSCTIISATSAVYIFSLPRGIVARWLRGAVLACLGFNVVLFVFTICKAFGVLP